MLRNVIKIFSGTTVSRLFGFFRELVVAFYFGTGKIADAFALALIFPNLFRQILGEDVVERAFMPPFKTIYDKGDKKRAWKFISVVFNWFFVSLLVATFLLYILIPLIFSLRFRFPDTIGALFGADANFDYSLTLNLIFILLPFMVFIGVAAFVGSMLNFFGRNWIFAFAPVMLSVGVIIGILALEPVIGGYSIAVGYVLGAFLQMLIQLPFIFSKKFKKETELQYSGVKLKEDSVDFKSLKRETKIIGLNAIFNKSHEVFSRFFASTLITGATSSLFYATRLYQLPFAIISLSVSRAVNPELNRMKSNNDFSSFDKLFSKGLIVQYVIISPIIFISILASREIIFLFFGWGKFDENSLNLTSSAFQMYVLGLLPLSLIGYYTKVLSLFNKNKYALKISIFSALLNIFGSLLFVLVLGLGHEGIALASSVSFAINMLILRKNLFVELSDFTRNRYFEIMLFLIIECVAIIILLFTKYTEDTIFTHKYEALSLLGVKILLIFLAIVIFIVLNSRVRGKVLGLLKRVSDGK